MRNTNTKPSGCILLAEDDATTRIIQTALLEDLNYEVLQATDGIEALKLIYSQSHKLDIIVMDKYMPDMGGIEVTCHLQRNEKTRNIPVIMVTSADTPKDRRDGMEAGVFCYLIKPYKEEELISALNAALQKTKPFL